MGHLTTEERLVIAQGIKERIPRRVIAEKIGRHPSVVTREIQRNKPPCRTYTAYIADKQAKERRQNRPITRKMEQPEVLQLVTEKLQENWSPEQVSQRLVEERGDKVVSPETIYAFLRALPFQHSLRKAMRRGGRKYRLRKGGIRSTIPDRTSIHDRPQVVNDRKRFGDWEMDLVVGTQQSGYLITAVERKSGFLKMIKINDKRTKTVMAGILKLFADEDPKRLKSLTFDNGTEFTDHQILRRKLGVKTYFADPYCSGQRGTNENTNGLVRQYMPKSLNFGYVSVRDVCNALEKINNRPRKRLRYRTPREVLYGSRKIAFQF